MAEQTLSRLKQIVDNVQHINPLQEISKALMDKHHPYGLLLMSTPLISAATGGQLDAVGLGSSSIVVNSFSDTEPGTTGKLLKNLSSAGSLGLSLSGHSPEASLSIAGISLSLMNDKGDNNHFTVGALLSAVGLSAGADPNIANALRNSFEFDAGQTGAAILPMLASIKKEQNLSVSEQPRIEVNEKNLRVGSVSVIAYAYSGREAYEVANPELDQPQVVNPGDIFLVLHVNQSGKNYAKMEPLARVRAIKKDFQQLCEILDYPDSFDLAPEQVTQIQKLSKAPMIGVSHLVRLIAARGLPTWTIKDLPKAVQVFHKFDSQAVSYLFGGKRKVDTSDIKVMFLPATMRSYLS